MAKDTSFKASWLHTLLPVIALLIKQLLLLFCFQLTHSQQSTAAQTHSKEKFSHIFWIQSPSLDQSHQTRKRRKERKKKSRRKRREKPESVHFSLSLSLINVKVTATNLSLSSILSNLANRPKWNLLRIKREENIFWERNIFRWKKKFQNKKFQKKKKEGWKYLDKLFPWKWDKSQIEKERKEERKKGLSGEWNFSHKKFPLWKISIFWRNWKFVELKELIR